MSEQATLKKSALVAELATGSTVKEAAKNLGVSQKNVRDGATQWGINLRAKPVKSRMVIFEDDTVEETAVTNTQEAAFNNAPQSVVLE